MVENEQGWQANEKKGTFLIRLVLTYILIWDMHQWW